ncbi:MAG: hypothetical protein KAU35_09300 [candidate division Zixibacteria bacterium]|nr:hypothetical protein [candidate division Zixibacteria bacterium]
MKRFLVLLVAVVLVAWLAAPATSVAQTAPPGDPENVWMDDPLVPGTWPTEWTYDDPDALARLLRTGQAIDSSCNKTYWDIQVSIHASIAQWVKWSLSHQGWYWEVKKPGCYAGNCIAFQIHSNGDIFIDYKDFNALKGTNTHKDTIDTYYAFGNSIGDAETNGWVPAFALNDDDDLLDESELVGAYDLHYGISYKLWNKVCVVECNTACEYHDDAMITLVLEQQKPFLDDNGNWKVVGTY